MPVLTAETKDLWRDLVGAEDLRLCYACGACISACPASHGESPLLIRRLIRMVALGLEDELLDEDSPWACVTCSRCEELCPMEVRPFELCLAIRKWQCKNDGSRVPLSTTEIYDRGYTQPVDKAEAVRRSVGLDERLPVIGDDADLLARFRSMLMETEVVRENSFMFGGDR
jgi:heterodisulfide reductase subunit C